MQEWKAAEPAQSFAYEIRENSAVILRCFSHDAKAEIPEALGGYPVTELGPYAFSAHFDEKKLREALRDGRAELYVPPMLRNERSCGAEPAPALCGDRLEEIVLPETVQRVGRYCFYNCGRLRRVEFYGALSDWGSGVFTGCHHVRSLRVYPDENGQSHLKDVLDELHEELEAEYMIQEESAGAAPGEEPGQREKGLRPVPLIFPEFYEEGVENTPARILETHVHGSGILYRNCFQGRKFDFAQYDVLFPYARAQESGELTARMALSRLRFPFGLTRRAGQQYEAYVKEHAREIGIWLLKQRDLESLRFLTELCRRGAQDRDAQAEEKRDGSGRQAQPPMRYAPGQEEQPPGVQGTEAQAPGVQGTETQAPGVQGMEAAGGRGACMSVYRALLSDLLEAALRLHYMEAVSFLMEQSRADNGSGRAGRPGRRRMEL